MLYVLALFLVPVAGRCLILSCISERGLYIVGDLVPATLTGPQGP